MYTRQELMHRLSDELAKLNTTNANIQAITDDLMELDAEVYAEAKYQSRIIVPMPDMKRSWDGASKTDSEHLDDIVTKAFKPLRNV